MNEKLLRFALEESRALKAGYHHLEHWVSVWTYGTLIGQQNGADLEVVEAFALLHDVARVNENHDPGHGERAADLLEHKFVKNALEGMTPAQRVDLRSAISHHNLGLTTDNVTIGTCWDADRLDLPRVGIIPCMQLMSTNIGKALARDMAVFL